MKGVVPLSMMVLLISGSMILSWGGTKISSHHLRILSSDAQGMVLELTVNQVRTEIVEYDTQTYHRLVIPGMTYTATPGAPQLPTRGALLGVPSTQDLTLHILEADYETLHGYALSPAPDLHVTGDSVEHLLGGEVQHAFAFNHDLYAVNTFSPDVIAAMGHTGYVRDQAVAQVRFSPVQYNPITSEVRLYRRIRVRLSWSAPVKAARTERRSVNPAFEPILRSTLLNAHALDRGATVERSPLPDALDAEGVAANDTRIRLKIGVMKDGFYTLTYDDLTDAGFDLGLIDPRTITMSHRGVETPIEIQGESDGVFDPADTILFYGTAITDRYTSTNVYWLTAGATDGQRIRVLDGAPSGRAPVAHHFPVTLHAEEDTYYWQTIPNGAGQDHWFWDDKLNPGESRDYPLALRHISTADTATVRVRLKGRTDIPALHPDHHTKLYLNGVEIDDQLWDGQRIFDHEVTVPHTLLHEGDNTITLETVGDTGANIDQLFVNWIEIDYWDTYVAEDDALRFGPPAAGTFQFKVAGFQNDDVDLFDVTDPTNVVRITHTSVISDGNTYTAQFEHTAQPETRYLAQTPMQRQSPASIEIDVPSSWQSPNHGADYIIITHEDFYASAQKLAAHRRTSGLRVVIVNVGDIYDEFNDGIFHPQAIQDFLSYAYHHWVRPAPTYVLLIGDAYQDYKDNARTGTINYVPSQIIETDILGETPSDNWFVLVSGDDILPDMLIGRLSVRSAAQAEAAVNKIIGYERQQPEAAWRTQALFVADDQEPVFVSISEQLADFLPPGYTARKVYAMDYPPGDPTVDISQYINDGTILVNYTGHGSVNRWGLWNGSNSIFKRSDIAALQNTHRLPVVTVADCLNGYFVGRRTQISVAEAFQRLPDRGAVAIWAPTALSYSSGHRLLMRAFYQALFPDGQRVLGVATTAAKLATFAQSSFWRELVETFVLFGDPAMSVGISNQ